jgi:RNA polymerase sigma factor (sigma-70 family)
MPRPPLLPVLRQLRTWLGSPDDPAVTDGQLLRRFARQQDEAAFAALVQRHGPMVLGVCRRRLRHEADAEDAFQASFLVLLRRAASIRRHGSVAAWLHGVALRVAARAQADAARRRHHEEQAPERHPADPGTEAAWRELAAVLDEELLALPERYRLPLVLCGLEGRSRSEAARLLGWREGTVGSRLARGREALRRRLTRRGLTVPAGVLGALWADGTLSAAVPGALAVSTARWAALVAAGEAAAAEAVPGSVAALAKGALQGMLFTKLKAAAVLLALIPILALGAVAAARQAWPMPPAPVAAAPRPVGQQAGARTDRYGDPLPDGAVVRLGTLRFNHGDGLNALFFSPDGRSIISEGNGIVRLWDPLTGKELRQFVTAQPLFDSQTALAPDGQTLTVLGQKFPYDLVRSWDVDQGREVGTLSLPAWRREIADRRRNALSRDGTLCAVHTPERLDVFDTATGQKLYELPKRGDEIRAAVFGGNALVTADHKQAIEVWEARTGKPVRQFQHGSPVEVLVASADGRLLATLEHRTSSIDRFLDRDVVHVWDLTTGTRKHTLAARPQRWYLHVQFAPDGKLLFASSHGLDQTELTVWDVEAGQRLHELCGVNNKAIAVSPDGSRLALGGESTFDLWDLGTGRRLASEDGRRAWAATPFLSPDGNRAFTVGYASIGTWDCRTGRPLHSFGVPTFLHGLPRPSCSPDGRYAITFSGDLQQLEIHLWDVAAQRRLHTLRPLGASQGITAAFSPDSSLLAIASSKRSTTVVRLWDVRSGKEVRSFPEAKAGWPGLLFFAADGQTLSVAGPRTVGIDVGRGKELFSWRLEPPMAGPGQHITKTSADGRPADETDRLAWRTLAVSPDGAQVACILSGDHLGDGRVEDRILLCEARTGRVLRRWSDSGKPSRFGEQITFSPDSRLLASSDGDAVHVWEVATGKEVRTLQGHRGEIRFLAFGAKAERLATASTDSTVLIWDLTK